MKRTQSIIKTVDWEKLGGLVPVVTQDYTTNRVLMVGFMNKEAFEKTLREKKVTYFSRTKKRLWTKGETSGHFQFVKAIFLDCDNDTLLIKVEQKGRVCHTNHTTCFFKKMV